MNSQLDHLIRNKTMVSHLELWNYSPYIIIIDHYIYIYHILLDLRIQWAYYGRMYLQKVVSEPLQVGDRFTIIKAYPLVICT